MPEITLNSHDALHAPHGSSRWKEAHIEGLAAVDLIVEYYKEEAISSFHTLQESVLPTLPHGYHWIEHDGKNMIAKDGNASDHDLRIILYGPKSNGRINFIFQVDEKTTYGFAHCKKQGSHVRSDIRNSLNFHVSGFNYEEWQYSSHVRGHVIDAADTIKVGRESTMDRRNYVPEPPSRSWGMDIRNHRVNRLRRSQTGVGYSQSFDYPAEPLLTVDGTPVPEFSYFTPFDLKDNRYIKHPLVYSITWDDNFKRPHKGISCVDFADQSLSTPAKSSPSVRSFSPTKTSPTMARSIHKMERERFFSITDGLQKSRFPSRDGAHALANAVNIELYGINATLNAALFFNGRNNPKLTDQYAKTALARGQAQLALDGKLPIVNKLTERSVARKLFNENTYVGNADVEALTDAFNQLRADQNTWRKT